MRRKILGHVGLIVVAICLLSGCAPAYHAYQNGCVTYGYRPQAAPPFTLYRGCPTPWLQRHAGYLENCDEELKAFGGTSSRRQASLGS